MTRNDWDDYRFVLALFHRGNVAAAAQFLGVNETTVTRRLAQLEESLGVQLFARARGRALPTDACERIADRLMDADNLLRQVRDEVSGADGIVAGSVRVTTTPSIGNHVLVPRLGELLQAHEQLQVELVVDAALLEITRSREVDVAIRGIRPDSDPDAVTRKLGDLHYGVYCQRELHGREAEPGWIAYEGRGSGLLFPTWIETQLELDGGPARLRVNDGESLLRCVRAGLGKTVLSNSIAARYPELVRIESPDSSPPSREIWMVMHPSYHQTRRVAVVIEWLDTVVGEFLASQSASEPTDVSRTAT